MAKGANSTTMPMLQARLWITYSVVGPPSMSARVAFTAAVTGWWLAKTWSHPGMVDVDTNADEANTSGARIGNDMAWAVSGSLALRPTMAKIHVIEKANSRRMPMPASSPRKLVWTRNPTA